MLSARFIDKTFNNRKLEMITKKNDEEKSMQEYNILVAGVGGLGILTATRIIAEAALLENRNVIMSEIHGLSQRYGTVITNLRIGDVFSPLIKREGADLIIGLEPVEALRNIYMVKKNAGYAIINLNKIEPPTVTAGIDEYPELDSILKTIREFTKNVITLNALEIAEKLGSPLLQNTILLGVAFSIPTFPLKIESGKEAIKKVFSEKPKIIPMNLKAFDEGFKLGQNILSEMKK